MRRIPLLFATVTVLFFCACSEPGPPAVKKAPDHVWREGGRSRRRNRRRAPNRSGQTTIASFPRGIRHRVAQCTTTKPRF